MNSDVRQAKEHLARAKAYFDRHDTQKSMGSAASAIKILARGKVTGRERMVMDALLKQLIAGYNRTKEIEKFSPGPLVFKEGGEKELHAHISKVISNILLNETVESYEQTVARKAKLDKILSFGKKLLAVGRVADALGLYDEALKLHKDENVLFRLIGKELLDAKQPRPAIKFLKKALDVETNKKGIVDLLMAAHMANGNIAAAKKLEAEWKNKL